MVSTRWLRTVRLGAVSGIVVYCLRLSASAAAPWVLMLHGGYLTGPRYLVDWQKNQRLMTSLSSAPLAPVADLDGRLYAMVRAYSGPRWSGLVTTLGALSRLDPAEGSQPGRYYPPHAGKPAVLYGKVVPVESAETIALACVIGTEDTTSEAPRCASQLE